MDPNEQEIHHLIQQGENLELEFKSDRQPLPDRELVAAVVALANTEGGVLLLGVEDDGTITGLHPNHEDISGIPGLIGNRTNLYTEDLIYAHVHRLYTCVYKYPSFWFLILKPVDRLPFPKSANTHSRF